MVCESNNPVSYVSQESMNTKKLLALISCVVELQGCVLFEIPISKTLSFWSNLSHYIQSQAFYSRQGVHSTLRILSLLLHEFQFLGFSLKWEVAVLKYIQLYKVLCWFNQYFVLHLNLFLLSVLTEKGSLNYPLAQKRERGEPISTCFFF